MNQVEPSKNTGLIAQHRQEIQTVATQRWIISHDHHTLITVKEGLQHRCGLHQRFGKIGVAALCSQGLQGGEHVEHALLTGGFKTL